MENKVKVKTTFTILAEYYKNDKLISYIIKNSKGKIMEVKKEIVENWK